MKRRVGPWNAPRESGWWERTAGSKLKMVSELRCRVAGMEERFSRSRTGKFHLTLDSDGGASVILRQAVKADRMKQAGKNRAAAEASAVRPVRIKVVTREDNLVFRKSAERRS